MKTQSTEYIGVCEECSALFRYPELLPDGEWGHVCKMKKYKEEHRCESYRMLYLPEEA